jgi:hypothetical protein
MFTIQKHIFPRVLMQEVGGKSSSLMEWFSMKFSPESADWKHAPIDTTLVKDGFDEANRTHLKGNQESALQVRYAQGDLNKFPGTEFAPKNQSSVSWDISKPVQQPDSKIFAWIESRNWLQEVWDKIRFFQSEVARAIWAKEINPRELQAKFGIWNNSTLSVSKEWIVLSGGFGDLSTDWKSVRYGKTIKVSSL